ncbi:hypothetical protein AAH678_28870 [Sodalis endosymbiont of Spalangia cameroni]|uniref:hypothetical protein n=1 Tax=Sodalis praecaptivus TaxID=1239307 RepID=UPI0031F7F711
MNYAGNEALRAELAALLGESHQMHMRLRELSRRYLWDSEALIEHLAGQVLHDAYERHIEIFKTLSVLEDHFKD